MTYYYYPRTKCHQCITVRQRTARYPFVHSSVLFLSMFCIFHSSTLFMLQLFSWCFMLHSLHVALFLCCTHYVLDFIRVALFHIALFSSWTFFVLYPVHVAPFCALHTSHVSPFLVLLHVALITCCTFSVLPFFMLHSLQVSFFFCCTLFVLHFSVLHFLHFTLILSSTFFMLHSFSCRTFFRVALFSCCTLFVLHFFMLHFFHVELFSWCTLFVLYRFHVAPFCVLHCFHVAPLLVLPHVHVALFRHSGQKLYKKRPNHRCFPAKFVKFLRTPILKNICD